MRLTTLLIVIALGIAVPAAAFAQAGGIRMAYRGELIDDSGVPISGVFPLAFKLYGTEDGRSAIWEETRYVAVYEGTYDIVLGAVTPIAAEHEGEEAFVAVELGDVGEITRHAARIVALAGPQTRAEVVAELDITYADVADRALYAVEARDAQDCVRLGGKTLEDLDRYDEVLEEIAQLRDRLDDVSGARLGSRTTTLERIGGAGGNTYSRTCPPGHVVTGARGGAGALIDSMELICSPLQ